MLSAAAAPSLTPAAPGPPSQLLDEMQALHEQWAGFSPGGLSKSNAYGLRVYERGNSLTMHTDHVSTHVIR